MKRIIYYFKKDIVLTVSWVLAAASAFLVRPDKGYVGYIDWSSDIAVPDKGTAFVFIADWQVMAISIGINKVYHLKDDGWV